MNYDELLEQNKIYKKHLREIDNDHNFNRVDKEEVDYCLYCSELWCCLLPKQHKRMVKKSPVITEESIQCPECLAYEELTFSDGVLEGKQTKDVIYPITSGNWRQDKDGKITHDCLL